MQPLEARVLLSAVVTGLELDEPATATVIEVTPTIEVEDDLPGSVSGVVWRDLNANSLRDGTGSTVAPNITFAQPGDQILQRNDDWSTESISLGFTFNFFGETYDRFFINNNGNVTFESSFSSFTSTGFPASTPMIAPFWADVDTRPPGSDVVRFTSGTSSRGMPFVQVDWRGVGYFSYMDDKLNDFSLYMEDHPLGDIVAFRYGELEWTTGSASDGSGGFGGTGAQLGFDAGDGANFLSLGRPNSLQQLEPFENTVRVFQIGRDGGVQLEPGIANVTVYADLNDNGSLDLDEPATLTAADGTYLLENIPEGEWTIRQVVPAFHYQTFPQSLAGHDVVIESSETIGDLNFGNALGQGAGVIEGIPDDAVVVLPGDITEQPGGGGVIFDFIVPLPPIWDQAPIWFDPDVAVGYDYEVISGPGVAQVVLPQGYGDSLFTIEVTDPASALFGDIYADVVGDGATALSFDEAGVRQFRLTGIEPQALVDPESPTAFPLGMTFVSADAVNLTQTPIVEFYEPSMTESVTVGANGLTRLTYTDPDDDEITVELRDGLMTLSLVDDQGETIDHDARIQEVRGGYLVTGGPVTIDELVLTETSDRSRLSMQARGGDGQIDIRYLTAEAGASALNQLDARGDLAVNLDLPRMQINRMSVQGDLTGEHLLLGDISRLDVGGNLVTTDDTFVAGVVDRFAVRGDVEGRLIFTSVDRMDIGGSVMGSISLHLWEGGDDAPGIGRLSVRGDFEGWIDTAGASVGRIDVGGNLIGDLPVHPTNGLALNTVEVVAVNAFDIGDVDRFSVRGNAAGVFTLGHLNRMDVGGDLDGQLMTQGVGRLNVRGNMTGRLDTNQQDADRIDVRGNLLGLVFVGALDRLNVGGALGVDPEAAPMTFSVGHMLVANDVNRIAVRGMAHSEFVLGALQRMDVGGTLRGIVQTQGIGRLNVRGDLAALVQSGGHQVDRIDVRGDVTRSIVVGDLNRLTISGDFRADPSEIEFLEVLDVGEVMPTIDDRREAVVARDVDRLSVRGDFDGELDVASIQRIDVGGDLDVLMRLADDDDDDSGEDDDAEGLGRLNVRGNLTGVIDTHGRAVDRLDVRGNMEGWFTFGDLNRMNVGGDFFGGEPNFEVFATLDDGEIGATDIEGPSGPLVMEHVDRLSVRGDFTGELIAESIERMDIGGDLDVLMRIVDDENDEVDEVDEDRNGEADDDDDSGGVGRLNVRGNVAGWINTHGQAVDRIDVRGNMDGAFSFGALTGLNVGGNLAGEMLDADEVGQVNVRQNVAIHELMMNSVERMAIAGWMEGTRLHIPSVGQASIGGLRDVMFSADEIDRFEVRGVRGEVGPSLLDAHIEAQTIGRIQLRQVDVGDATPPSGSLSAIEIDDYQRDNFRLRPVTEADADMDGVFDQVGEYVARIGGRS